MQKIKLVIICFSLCLSLMSVSVKSFAESTNEAIWSGQVMENGENTVFNLPELNNALYDLEKKKVMTMNEFYQADFEDYRVYLEGGNLTFENKKTTEKNVVEKNVTHDRFFVSQKYVYCVNIDHQQVAVFDEKGHRVTEIKLGGPCSFLAEGGKLYAYQANTNSTIYIGYIDPEKGEFKYLMNTEGYGLNVEQGGLFIWTYKDEVKGFFSDGKTFSYPVPEYSRYTMDGESIYYLKNETDIYKINSNETTGKLLIKSKEKIERIHFYQGKLILITNDWQYREIDLKEKIIKKTAIKTVYDTINFNGKMALVINRNKTALMEREATGKTRTIVEDVRASVVKEGVAYYIDLKENLNAIEIATGNKLWTIERKQLAQGKVTDQSSLKEEYGLALVGDKLFGFQEYGTFVVNTNGKLIQTGDKAYLQYRSADGYATYHNDDGYGIWNLNTNKITNIDLNKSFEMTRNGYTIKIKPKKVSECLYQIDIFKGSKKLLSGVAQSGDDMIWIGEDAFMFMVNIGNNYDSITKTFSFKTGKINSQRDLNTHSNDSTVCNQIAVIGHQDNHPEVLMGYEPKTGNLMTLHKDRSTAYFQYLCKGGLLIDRRMEVNPKCGYYDIFNRFAFYESLNSKPIEFNLLNSSYDGVQYLNGIIYMLDNGGVVYTLDPKTMEEVYFCQ